MNIQKIKSYFQLENISFFSVAFALYTICCSMALNHGDTTLGNSTIHVIFVIIKNLSLLCAAITFFKVPKSFSLSGYFLFIAIVLLDALSGFSNLIVTYIGFIIFFFCNKDAKWQCYEIFYAYMVVTGLIGIFCYLSFVFGLPLPYKTVDYYGADLAQSYGLFYVDYSLSYLVVSFDGIRLCGLFNEPGYYGTISAMLLISNGCNFKDKRNIILLIAGMLTISLAFCVLVVGYITIANISKIKKLISILFVSGILLLVLIKVGVIPESTVNTFMERFTLTNATFSGDNRSNYYLDSEFEKLFSDTSHFAWGYGNLEKFAFKGVASYKLFMLQYGVIGSIIAMTLLFLAALKTTRMTYHTLLFIGLFFISFYQRPYAFELVYILVLIGGIYNIEKMKPKALYRSMPSTESN